MAAITYNALKLAQRFRDNAKFSPEQAEQAAMAVAESFAEWQEAQELATKSDVRESELRLETRMAEIKVDLIKWVVGTGFAQAALILAVLKLHDLKRRVYPPYHPHHRRMEGDQT